MAIQVKMPQLGETVVEGTITRWLKREGEAVHADESLLEVSTDKVDSEIPAPASGTVARIHVAEGETVQVGTLLAEIAAEGEAVAPPAPPVRAAEPAPAKPAEGDGRVEAERPAAVSSPQRPEQPERMGRDPLREIPTVAASAEAPRRAILSPLVRRLAAEHGVDLQEVQGTGVGGRITKQDVVAFVQSRGEPAAPLGPVGPAASIPAAAPPPPVIRGGEEVIQVSHMRKAIAEHMVKSHLESARAWNAVEVDMGKIGRLRELAGPAFKEREGFSLTWMPFVTKAVTLALGSFPQVNSTWNGDGTVTRKHF
ncbi:MAG: biotin/lipoyl-containing protein, partial [Actinomycetota bacterium]